MADNSCGCMKVCDSRGVHWPNCKGSGTPGCQKHVKPFTRKDALNGKRPPQCPGMPCWDLMCEQGCRYFKREHQRCVAQAERRGGLGDADRPSAEPEILTPGGRGTIESGLIAADDGAARHTPNAPEAVPSAKRTAPQGEG